MYEGAILDPIILTFYKYMERLWEPKWPLRTQTFSELDLKQAPRKPHIWWRYIDDIFTIWTHSLEDLDAFTTFLDGNQPTIKFTCNHSFTSIPFSDVDVIIINDKIMITDLYPNPTDKHQYLLHSSYHPTVIHQTCYSFQFNSQIAQADKTFTLRTNAHMTSLHKRGHNRHDFLGREITRAKNITRNQAHLPKSASTITTDASE